MAYGVYFSGRLQKAFIHIDDARNFARKSFDANKVETITLSQLNPNKRHLWEHKLMK